MSAWRRLWALAAVVVAGAVAGACSDQLDAGGTCPALCPDGSLPIRDTIIRPALVFDTTIAGFPSRGQETGLLLANRGDTLDVRAVLRFDTLTSRFAPPNDTGRPISTVLESYVRMRLNLTGSKLPQRVTVEAYDVDTAGADFDDAPVIAAFRPARRLGSVTFLGDTIADSLRIPLDTAVVRDRVQNGKRLRIGLRATGSGPVQFVVQSIETGFGANLVYKVSADTSVAPISTIMESLTPVDIPIPAADLRDYSVVVKGPAGPPAGVIAAGGLPGRRAYLRFNIPSRLVDSVTVVKATLLLTQRPNRLMDARDSVSLYTQATVASSTVTDLRWATSLILPRGLLVSDTLHLAPADSGLRTVELVSLLRGWAGQVGQTGAATRAVVLRVPQEGVLPQTLWFWGTKAPAALQPGIRISYTERSEVGLP